MLNFLYRCVFKVLYIGAIIAWRILRISSRGTFVGVWYDGKILLLRTSYKRDFGFPGSMVDRNESYIDAAVRELYEEAHITATTEQLKFIKEIPSKTTRNITCLYELYLDEAPDLQIDMREIIWAEFVSLEDALSKPHLMDCVLDYLEEKKSQG